MRIAIDARFVSGQITGVGKYSREKFKHKLVIAGKKGWLYEVEYICL